MSLTLNNTIELGRGVSAASTYFRDQLEEEGKPERFNSRFHQPHNDKLMRLDRMGDKGVRLSVLRSVEIV